MFFRNPIQFTYTAESRLEITGHIVAHLTVSASRIATEDQPPSDIDIFVTLRKLDGNGKEVHFTGTMGDPIPITKGWLRVSLRKVDSASPYHREYLPHRNYYSTDVQPVVENERYTVDIEVWPTNVVLDAGQKLVFEVAGHDTQGVGNFSHDHPGDRAHKVFSGNNTLHVGSTSSYIILPVIDRP